MKSADATIARVSRKTLAPLAVCALAAACSRKPAEERALAAQATPASPADVDSKKPLPDPLPMVAARVNGRNIPTSHVVGAAETALRNGVVKDKLLAYRQTLNQLVIRELLLEEAVARRLAAERAPVERAYDEARVAYKDDAEWQEALRKQGFTPDGFREELRAKQTVSLLLSQEAQKVAEPTEAELRDFYAKNPTLFGGEQPRFEDVKDRLAQHVAQLRRQEHLQGLVDKLRARARIETFL